jgi:molybdopterin converting factor small subunit
MKILELQSGEVWLIKLGGQLVDADHPLQPEDELALIPPIGGGRFWEFEEALR